MGAGQTKRGNMIKPNITRIEEFLNFRRWTQADLAEAMKFSAAYITRILNGERKPTNAFMDRMVIVTGLSLGELFFSVDTPKNGKEIAIMSQNCHESNEIDQMPSLRSVGSKSQAVGPKLKKQGVNSA